MEVEAYDQPSLSEGFSLMVQRPDSSSGSPAGGAANGGPAGVGGAGGAKAGGANPPAAGCSGGRIGGCPGNCVVGGGGGGGCCVGAPRVGGAGGIVVGYGVGDQPGSGPIGLRASTIAGAGLRRRTLGLRIKISSNHAS